MNKNNMSRIDRILCHMMRILLLSSMSWSSMFIGKFIITPFIENPQVITTWRAAETVLFVIMICLTLFWTAFALSERFGLLDKIENRFNKNKR